MQKLEQLNLNFTGINGFIQENRKIISARKHLMIMAAPKVTDFRQELTQLKIMRFSSMELFY